jgi:hypothetical protein
MRIAGNTRAERASGEVAYHDNRSDPYAINVTRLDSTGGWLASATDLVNFATHVDGFSSTPNILRKATIKIMTTSSIVNRLYAHGWGVIDNDWWHDGGLPGTTSIIIRTQSGFCWAALANTNQKNSNYGMDKMVRNMGRLVKRPLTWQNRPFFQ